MIGFSGSGSDEFLSQLFRPINNRPYSSSKRKIVYGTWISTEEDLVVFRRGDEHFEIHCHGGSTAAAAIIHSLQDKGCTEVAPDVFLQVFVSAWETSSQSALANAPTIRTAEILLRQSKLLPAAISKIREWMKSGDQVQALAEIESMLKWAEFGIHLTAPRSIVLCGQPNVGKSSLINAIVGFQRAIVHHAPGTTRDVVSQSTAIDGWPVILKDTAGIRESSDAIEAQGIEKARAEIEAANLKVCVFDGTTSWSDSDQELTESIQPDLIVFNKTDLQSANVAPSRPAGLETSATTGQGMDELISQVGDLLVPELPPMDQAIPVSTRQRDQLREILSLDQSRPT